MKTWPFPHCSSSIASLLLVLSCRKVRMQKSLALESANCTQPGSGSSSLTVESFLRESGSGASQGGSAPGLSGNTLPGAFDPRGTLKQGTVWD